MEQWTATIDEYRKKLKLVCSKSDIKGRSESKGVYIHESFEAEVVVLVVGCGSLESKNPVVKDVVWLSQINCLGRAKQFS
jgi:hypothetical protein